MEKEYKFIIDCLKNYINNKNIELKDDIDFSTILRLSNYNEVSGIVYKEIMPSFSAVKERFESASYLEKQYSKNLFYYSNIQSVLAKIDSVFTQKGIKYVIVKGTEIANYYNDSFLRTMGDCDILVKREDRRVADKLLTSIGLKNRNKGPNEWVYKYDNMVFELHYTLMSDEEENTPEIKEFLDKVWDYAKSKSQLLEEENSVEESDDDALAKECVVFKTDIGVKSKKAKTSAVKTQEENTIIDKNLQSSTKCDLDINYHFVFLIIHLYKHFIDRGVGVRQFLDIAFLIKKCDLDWEFIAKSLNEINLLEFAVVCFSFIYKWFNVKAPYRKELDKKFYEESSVTLIENGVFGFNNEENENNYEIYQLSNYKNKKVGKIRKIFRFLFPSYKSVKDIKYYSFVKGKPFLMPILWIYRLFRMIFKGKTKKSLATVKGTITISDEQINKRVETLKNWGIKSR